MSAMSGPTADSFYDLPTETQIERVRGLARRALPEWGIDSSVELPLVAERENVVFRIDGPPAAGFAVRVHRAGYHSDAQLWSQIVWARALSADGVIHTAEVVDTTAGAAFAIAEAAGVPEPRQVTLLRWVPGTPLADLGGGDAAVLEQLGVLMATLHDHASRWEPPAGFDVLRWDVDGLVGDAPEWGRFWECADLDPDERSDLVAFRDRARAELREWGEAPDRFSLVHGDFLPENLLIDRDETVTLLDFDDCGFGWHLFDIATALAMPSLRRDFPELRDAFVGGYRTRRALPDEHLARLPLFLALRAATYAGWMHTRAHTAFAQAVGPMVIDAAVATVRDYLATPPAGQDRGRSPVGS